MKWARHRKTTCKNTIAFHEVRGSWWVPDVFLFINYCIIMATCVRRQFEHRVEKSFGMVFANTTGSLQAQAVRGIIANRKSMNDLATSIYDIG